MFGLGDRFILFLAGKALLGVGLIAAILSIILNADVAIIVSICVIVLGSILALEGA